MTAKLLSEEDYARTMTEVVAPALDACRTDGWMEPAHADMMPRSLSGDDLHYVCYDAERFDDLGRRDATATFRGVVVVSHGFTEFADRFRELAWYLLIDGYSVCMLEHRGHGRSPRDLDDDDLVWIDDWHRYADDLAKFCATVGEHYANGAPLFLYGHSMGGGVAAAVVERHPTLIDKAVLSAPMIAPRTGLPVRLAMTMTGLLCELGMDRCIAPTQKRFTERLDEESCRGLSMARARWIHGLRLRHHEYRTSAATIGWVYQSLLMTKALLSPAACADVETPLLVFQADHDDYVLPEPQNLFVSRVQAGGCPARLVRLHGARHELLLENNDIMQRYVDTMLEFLHRPLIEEQEWAERPSHRRRDADGGDTTPRRW